MLSEINLENTKPNSNIIDTLTKSLPQYTIFYAIYTLYRILYIFLFLVPHITNKFKNYLSFIFERLFQESFTLYAKLKVVRLMFILETFSTLELNSRFSTFGIVAFI